jgi:CheY-like chemotaxis protein
MRALILDDDPTVIALLEKILRDRGHEALTYTNPQFCPAYTMKTCPCALSTCCPDMILTDVNMPVVNGLDFVKTLREKGCRCPNIALISGNWTDPELRRACALGVSLFSKPILPARLSSWLDQVERKERRNVPVQPAQRTLSCASISPMALATAGSN